jgi:hypothetical protein
LAAGRAGEDLLGGFAGLPRFGILKSARPEAGVMKRGDDCVSGDRVGLVADEGSARQNPDEMNAFDSFELRAHFFFIVFVIHVRDGEIEFRERGGVSIGFFIHSAVSLLSDEWMNVRNTATEQRGQSRIARQRPTLIQSESDPI